MSDFINGLFELGGACFILLHVRQLYIDKQIRGMSKLPFIWFTSWGFFNIHYYSNLSQWWSFYGGLAVVSVNTVYCGMLWRYRNN